MTASTHATIDDLRRADAKAELVGGEIVLMSPAGDDPNRASGGIYVSLRSHEGRAPGKAYTDNAGFECDLPHRKSFSPDAAWYTGPPGRMRFLPRAPDFAAEVRSENDYGPAADNENAAKLADYFQAGTLVVWDVDLKAAEIRVYKADDPSIPAVYRRGDLADAEPAAFGWRFPVAQLFD